MTVFLITVFTDFAAGVTVFLITVFTDFAAGVVVALITVFTDFAGVTVFAAILGRVALIAGVMVFAAKVFNDLFAANTSGAGAAAAAAGIKESTPHDTGSREEKDISENEPSPGSLEYSAAGAAIRVGVAAGDDVSTMGDAPPMLPPPLEDKRSPKGESDSVC